jgi:hypothetical protein
MKKVLFSLVALMTVMTVQAQSICGTWRMMQPVVETSEDGSFEAMTGTYTFNEDGTFHYAVELTESSEPAPTMALEIATVIEFKGNYTLDGDKLTLTPNMDTYKAEILSISMNGKVADNPMVKSQIKQMLNSADFKAQFAEPETDTVKVGDSSLELNDGEQTYNFMRFATIQN